MSYPWLSFAMFVLLFLADFTALPRLVYLILGIVLIVAMVLVLVRRNPPA